MILRYKYLQPSGLRYMSGPMFWAYLRFLQPSGLGYMAGLMF